MKAIQNPKTSKLERERATDRLTSLSQFIVQHARDIAEIAGSQNLARHDPVRHQAVIYFKGHIRRKIAKVFMVDEVIQLVDLSIKLLLDSNIQVSLNTHLEDALYKSLKRASALNSGISMSILQDFIQNKVKTIDRSTNTADIDGVLKILICLLRCIEDKNIYPEVIDEVFRITNPHMMQNLFQSLLQLYNTPVNHVDR